VEATEKLGFLPPHASPLPGLGAVMEAEAGIRPDAAESGLKDPLEQTTRRRR
jgi:hypothetical protein